MIMAIHIKIFSCLSGLRLVFHLSLHLNILCTSSVKYHVKNSNSPVVFYVNVLWCVLPCTSLLDQSFFAHPNTHRRERTRGS